MTPIAIAPALLRYGPYAIGIISIIGVLWWAYHSIYDSGRKDERVKWEKLAEKREHIYQKAVAEMQADAKARRIQQQHKLLQVLDEKAKRQQKLERDIARLSNQRMFVRAKDGTCPGETGLSKRTDPGPPGSTGGRVELHATVRSDILRLERDAQSVANQYNNLRDFVMKSDCLEVVE